MDSRGRPSLGPFPFWDRWVFGAVFLVLVWVEPPTPREILGIGFFFRYNFDFVFEKARLLDCCFFVLLVLSFVRSCFFFKILLTTDNSGIGVYFRYVFQGE